MHYAWVLKNRCFWIVVLEKTLESPLDCKEIQPVNHKGNQPWLFTERTDAEAEAPLLWLPWYEEPTHWKRPWCWESQGMRRRGRQRMRWLDGIINSRDMNLCKLRDIVKDREACHSAVHKVAKSWTWLSDWTRLSTEIPAGCIMCCCKPLSRPTRPSSDEIGCWGWILH